MAIDRQACIKRYIALEDELRAIYPTMTVPHLQTWMSDDEIVRHGQWLAKIVEQAKRAQQERQNQPTA